MNGKPQYSWTQSVTLGVLASSFLGPFPFVRTGQPDHYRTSYFDNEIGFFQGFLLKNHLLPTHYLGFDWSSWIVLINSQILITKERAWPVSSDKWKAPLVREWMLNRGSSKISITFSSNESFGNQYARGTWAVVLGSLWAEYVPLATQTPL